MKEIEECQWYGMFLLRASIEWAYLGMEMGCKKVKSFSESRTVVCAEIWAFSAFAKA